MSFNSTNSNISIEQRDEANQHLDRSISFAFTGKYDMAIEAVLKAIKLDPEFAQAYNKLGDYYVKKGMAKEAAKAYYKSLELDETNQNSHFDYGCTLALLGDYTQALRWLEKALAMKPDHYEIYGHTANIFYETGDYEAAVLDARKALAANPEDVMARFVLARAYLAQGKDSNAAEHFSMVIERYAYLVKIKDRFAEGHYYIGRAYYFTEKYNVAVEHLLKAVEYDTEDVDYHYSFGMLYSDADAFCALAEAQLANGQPKEALANINKALELSPSNARYQKVKQEI
jgi:tetratricopeptide (TPR) repeat protein